MRPRVLIVIAMMLPTALAGQSPMSRESPDGVMLQFVRFADIFGSRLVTAFDSIPVNKYDYRPTSSQQTIGYIAQHLEDANYSLCERLGDLKHPRTAKDSRRDGMLFVRSTAGGGAVRLWPESRDDFFVNEADAQVTFTRTTSGSVMGLVLHQYGRHRPGRKVR